jgi:NADH-quinone oxidoreductase subunit H
VRDAASPVFWFMAKVSVFMFMYIWYRGTFPRYRFDQLMRVGWKVLLPASLVVLILTGVVGVREELMAWVRGLG